MPIRRNTPRRYEGRRRAPITVSQGPFVGIWDSLDPTVASPKRAQRLRNCYRRPGVILGRPGFRVLGSQIANNIGQLVHQFTKLDGTEFTLAVVGGEIYQVNWATRAWSKKIATADLTGAAITLSSTARVYALTIANQVVFSDGTNIPFMWDGTAGGGLTKLTNADEFFGQPVEYYAKLFGIKKDDRATTIWSEENDPTTGYEAGSFDNAWTLGISDQAQLVGEAATNEALYYFRPYSIDAIAGAVTPDFRSSGTRSAVSDGVGTIAPASILVYGSPPKIFFTDALARPHVILPGQGVVPLWEAFEETLSGVDPTKFDEVLAFHDPATDLVGFIVHEVNKDYADKILVFDPAPGIPEPIAVWDGFPVLATGVVKDADGRKVWLHLSEDGYAYEHGHPYGTLWSDALNAGTEGIEHEVQSGAAGYDPIIEKHWDRVDFSFRAESDLSNLRLDVTTPRETADPQTADISANGARLDSFVLDTDRLANESLEVHYGFGLDANGRWIYWRLIHTTAGQRFGIETSLVTGYPLSLDPETP